MRIARGARLFTVKIPSFDALRKQTADDGISHSYASRMHPNPRFYKYRWWVFWHGSACDGSEFLAEERSLCTFDAMALIDRLMLKGECHWVYNRPMPREEQGVTPFDRTSEKWRNTQFAPPFDADTDPEWRGFR